MYLTYTAPLLFNLPFYDIDYLKTKIKMSHVGRRNNFYLITIAFILCSKTPVSQLLQSLKGIQCTSG